MKAQHIAIIGAGTAGLSSAALLARQGHQVTLFEKTTELKTVGAGILLQPSGLDVLDELNCFELIQQYGHRIDALHGSTLARKTIMDVHYSHLKSTRDLFGLGIHRSSLCHVLDVALAQVPHTRQFNTEVIQISTNPNHSTIQFCTNNQTNNLSFDAVIIANGSSSTLRPKEWVTYNKQYPWGAMWWMRPLSDALRPIFDQPYLQQRYAAASTMMGALPTGYMPNDDATQWLSFFWSVPIADIPTWQQPDFDLAQWKTQALALWPEAECILASVHSATELIPATYRDVILSKWGEGRIGVIGDAAHAMSPQLGQGANMALLDASALANAVQKAADWNEVWALFHQTRSGSIRFYQHMSRALTPFFQSNYWGAGWLRDQGVPLCHKIPWLRYHTAKTIAGTKQAWFS